MRLTEFGKANGKGQAQEAGPTFCVWAEADFASRCTQRAMTRKAGRERSILDTEVEKPK
jgi:hypothetical protein